MPVDMLAPLLACLGGVFLEPKDSEFHELEATQGLEWIWNMSSAADQALAFVPTSCSVAKASCCGSAE